MGRCVVEGEWIYKAFVFRKEDRNAGVDLADRERDKHNCCKRLSIGSSKLRRSSLQLLKL